MVGNYVMGSDDVLSSVRLRFAEVIAWVALAMGCLSVSGNKTSGLDTALFPTRFCIATVETGSFTPMLPVSGTVACC